jgi:hypothetical protein
MYYHQRDDKKRIAEKNAHNNKHGTEVIRFNESIKKRPSSSSIDREPHSSMSQGKESNKNHSIYHSQKPHERQWNISEIEKHIHEVYMAKKQILFKQGHKKNEKEI